MKIIKKVLLTETADVYCMEVPATHNFVLSNGVVAHNCCGSDLRQLLAEGFNGVSGRISSRPPKHLREALGQMANYMGILQGEWAGAQAFSSFDTLLAPYVFYDMVFDGQTESDIKKAIRSFVYNLNVPSRWGQCVPGSYKCLRVDGCWVNYEELKVGDVIYVIEPDTGKLKTDVVTHVNSFDAPKKMHHYSNKAGFNFWVTPNHRVIYRSGTNPYKIKESSELVNIKNISIPIAPWAPAGEEYGANEYDISDELLEFIVFIMTDGTIVHQEGKQTRLEFHKSPKHYGQERFEELCKILNVEYSTRNESSGHFGDDSYVQTYRMKVGQVTNKVIELLDGSKKKMPKFFAELSPRQAYIVLDAWVLLDGHFDGKHWRMQADTTEIQEMLAYLTVKGRKACSLSERLIGTNKNATKYTSIHRRANRCVTIEEGESPCEKVWCPTTKTGTFVCMTGEGYVFMTGNSPFTNLTLDWCCPEDMKTQCPAYKNTDMEWEQPLMFMLLGDRKWNPADEHDTLESFLDKNPGYRECLERIEPELRARLENKFWDECFPARLGEYMTYGSFEKEMQIIDKVFYEILNEGDSIGQPFTFPIPTVNITEKFDWDGPNTGLLFENAAKYGSSYFQNFIGSQYMIDENGQRVPDPSAYRPDDVRSMCPLTGDTSVLTRSQRGISLTQICHLDEIKHEVFYNGKWNTCKKVKVEDQDCYEITFSNGAKVKMGAYHLQPTLTGTVSCKDLNVGDWIPFNNVTVKDDTYNGSFMLGYAIGAFYGDGVRNEGGITYCLDVGSKDDETESTLRTFWSELGYRVTVTIEKNCRLVRIGGNSYSVIERFISGDSALTKKIPAAAFALSSTARSGIIAGYITTDGNRTRRRISTSSPEMVKSLITLFMLNGQKALLSSVDTRDNRLGNNPNYIVSYPERESYGDFYKTINGQLYFSIREIKKIPRQKLYCIAVDSDEHLFVLGNGLITHNCRLQLDKRQLRKRGGGLFGSDSKTGSIGVVTLNMARLGYLCKGNLKALYKRFDKLVLLAKSTLEKKRRFVTEMYNRGLYPFTKRYIKSYDTFFSTIGVNGMNEMVRNFTNDEYDITDERGQKMCLDLLRHLRETIANFQEETGNIYNVEATPGEGTTYRFAREDQKRFEDIIQAGTKDKPYYTNSSQLPVNFTEDPFAALDLQDELQCCYNGGTVLHLYMSERISDAETCKKLIKAVLTNYRLPYVSITPTFSVCPIHGYLHGKHSFCPHCDQEIIEKYSGCTCQGHRLD